MMTHVDDGPKEMQPPPPPPPHNGPEIESLLREANAAAVKNDWAVAAQKYNECLTHNAHFLPAIIGLFVQQHAACLGCSGKCVHFKLRDTLLTRANAAAKVTDRSSVTGNGIQVGARALRRCTTRGGRGC